MTREDVIRMAREAGILEPGYMHGRTVVFELQKFAALVAAAERNECAKLCERFQAVRNACGFSEAASAFGQAASLIRTRT